MNTGTTPRRTLPAPREATDIEAISAERDRLALENVALQRKLDTYEIAAREVAAMSAELSVLREELARLRDHASLSSRRAVNLPAPGRVPTGDGLFAPGEVPSGVYRQTEPTANAGIDFGTVSRLSPGELDQLPYGLICLDAQGRVVHYNDAESRLADLPKERVIGRNFFTDVAPCTRVREFEGEFYDLVRDPSRVRVRSFDFVFRFRHSEQHVTIVLTPARTRGLYNMALLRRSVTPR